MKAADYLKERGWVWMPRLKGWADPLYYGAPTSDDQSAGVLTEHAVTIQIARDEEKAREAWVAFAARFASTFVAETEHAQGGYWLEDHSAARKADAMLALYRTRFCPEVES